LGTTKVAEEEEEEEEEEKTQGMEGRSNRESENQDPFVSLLSMIEDLYCVRDTFFPLDPSIKKARLDNLMQQALIVLAEIASGAASRLVVFDVSCFWNQFCVVLFCFFCFGFWRVFVRFLYYFVLRIKRPA
jgi:hypothetical protein